jgi:DNA-formamidopyrimidine glycosylase
VPEGPQVRLRTEWLHQHLVGRQVVQCISTRRDIDARQLTDGTIDHVFCKGKHIFLAFRGGRYLHNHLKMRGTWRRFDSPLQPLPFGMWLGLDLGTTTIANLHGQSLRLVRRADVDRQLAALGPDTMADPFPEDAIRRSLADCSLPVTEALLDQNRVCGVGNIARSEALFTAGLPPERPVNQLQPAELDRLLAAIRDVLRDSYRRQGRWECRVYGRQGERCRVCGTRIATLILRSSLRTTYFCPQCQRGDAAASAV